MDRAEVVGVLVGVIVVCGVIAAALLGFTFLWASTYDGVGYDVTVTVQAVEHSSRFYPHTTVYAVVYGDQDVTYTFMGDHGFEIGGTYRIVFTDRRVFVWLFFDVAGDVSSVEKLS
jgi:hypothetical protein